MNDHTQKNRPSWRLRDRRGREKGCNAVFFGRVSRFGDGHPNRKRCIAKTRSGPRCRKDALQGSTCCGSHGGHYMAYRTVGHDFISLAAARSVTRKALATLSTIERFPIGVEYPASPVERGRVIEAVRNQRLGLTKRGS